MHAILLTVGTDGDIYPFVHLGTALRARGHSITLASSENFRGLATENGFAFAPLLSTEEMQFLLRDPDFWHPFRTVTLCAKWGAQFIERQYDLITGLIHCRETVLISSPAIFAAALVHEIMSVPLVSLLLQPWMIPSCTRPPVMPLFTFPSFTPKIAIRALYRLIDVIGDRLIGPELNRIRLTLNLKPAKRVLRNWFSNELIIGMFPESFGKPEDDWPKQLRLSGFPLFDGTSDSSLPADLTQFCSAKPTVAITFGTGMMHSARLFQDAIKACHRLGLNAVVLTKYRDQLPKSLPESILHSTFAPFQTLFPLCAAIVHHGGVGTTAKALASGTPQLVLPIAFDQMDNATRVQRLGAGVMLRAKKATAETISKELRKVLTKNMRDQSVRLREQFTVGDSVDNAARWIEQLHRAT